MTFFFSKAKPYLELATRIYVWLLLSIYGSGKIMGGQFHRRGNLPEELAQTPLIEVGSFDLAWTFFGYSISYIYFIGLSQLIGGFLLLFEKTKLIGVVILIPILANIIIMDYCFSVSTGAMMSAMMYFSALLFILFCNKKQVIETIQTMTNSQGTEYNKFPQKLIKVAISIAIVVFIIFIEQQLLNTVGR